MSITHHQKGITFMCKSKADGGQRCYSHAREALDRSLTDHKAARAESERARGVLVTFRTRQGTAQEPSDQEWADAHRAFDAASTALREAGHAVNRAQVSLASSERGALELHAEADALDDAADSTPDPARSQSLRSRAIGVRTHAVMGRTGVSVENAYTSVMLREDPMVHDRAARAARLDALVLAARRRSGAQPLSLQERLDGAAIEVAEALDHARVSHRDVKRHTEDGQEMIVVSLQPGDDTRQIVKALRSRWRAEAAAFAAAGFMDDVPVVVIKDPFAPPRRTLRARVGLG